MLDFGALRNFYPSTSRIVTLGIGSNEYLAASLAARTKRVGTTPI